MLETFGRYQLIEKLATGGMGQVFLARQKGPVGFEKLVVVKRILPHLSEEDEFIQMFFDEARIAAQLNHPNIAQIYDLGEVEGTYYIAMEYVQGVSLRAANTVAQQRQGGIPLALKCRIIADAAAGLDFAHFARNASGQRLSLIHRDISPQNILLGFNGSVKLIDFGVAKAAGKISTTLTGAIKGKYPYMSPEQARGEELDLRSDIFGLGIVFYEILTGGRLFKRESENATLKAVVGAKVPPPSSVVKGIPKQLDAIALKALARDRGERYQRASEFQLDIEDFLVRQRLPATVAHLSHYMRELYADELDADKTHSGVEDTGASSPRAPVKAKPSGTPASAGAGSASARAAAQLAAQVKRKGGEETTPERRGLKQSRSGASQSKRVRPTWPALSTADIASRGAGLSAKDLTSGCFFRAVLETANRHARPGQARELATELRHYSEDGGYPTLDFLELSARVAALLDSQLGSGSGEALFSLGAACLEAIPETMPGHPAAKAPAENDVRWPFSPLLKLLDKLAAPGKRKVDVAGPRSVTLGFQEEPLPPAFLAGFFTSAMAHFRGAAARVTASSAPGSAARSYALKIEW